MKLKETRVSDRLWSWTLGGETILESYGANCTAILGTDAVLVVDPLIAGDYARMVEEEIRRKISAPVRYVVLTHHHTDHTLGAVHFAARGAEVICHRRNSAAMAAEHPRLIAERRARPELANLFSTATPVSADTLLDDELPELTLDLGGVHARIFHPSHGHTPGDLVIHIPGESVTVCGDLVSAGYHVNDEDASPSGLWRGLDALEKTGATHFVPGHGPVSEAAVLSEQARYHSAVREIVREGIAGNLSDSQIVARLRERFPAYLLELVLPVAVTMWRRWLTSGEES